MKAEEKKFNLGICLLKILACFGVVNSHYGTHGGGEVAALPVPVFIFCSIFVAYPALKKGGLLKLRARLERLLVPFWCWGLIYFVLFSMYTKGFDISKLFWQLTFGHSVCKPLFFLPLLGIVTVVTYCLTRLERKPAWLSGALILFSLCIQYTGLNYKFFSELPDEMRWTCGRFFEVLPVAVVSCFISECLVYRSRARWLTCACISLVAIIVFMFNLQYHFIPSCQGFTKQGLGLFLGSVGFGTLFILMGEALPKLDSCNILVQMSGLMFGIYLLHVLVAQIFELFFGQLDSYAESLPVFLVSLVAVKFLSKLNYINRIVL